MRRSITSSSRTAASGRAVPFARKQDRKIELDLARIDHWTGTGAQMSDRVRALVSAYRKQAANG
ncbi:MAG: hypothetical protein H6R27_11 [Proteobacteria bacterium]|nr:hypothetical protein [Pseudomonadota bacterium]